MENYTSDSSDGEHTNQKKIDCAYLLLSTHEIDEQLDLDISKRKDIEHLILHHNRAETFPNNIHTYTALRALDLSNNGLKILPDVFSCCPHISTLIVKNNHLNIQSFPKQFTPSAQLRELNMSGNLLEKFPEQILIFDHLKYLYMGGNRIDNISKNIWKLNALQILSLGGNRLTDVPSTLGQMTNLQALILCDNLIENLPSTIANLFNLKSLLLHKNQLKTLPPEIVTLKNLTELSLRDNPLIVRFVMEMNHAPASLRELAARTIKLHNIIVQTGDLPHILIDYLHSANHCVNPRCKGVFFDDRVEHIKFVDFCGKYRIPLLQYLCSSKCANGNTVSTATTTNQNYHNHHHQQRLTRPSNSDMMKKVLLG